MRHQDGFSAVASHLFNGFHCGTNAGVIRNGELIVEWHIEINADEYTLTFEGMLVDLIHIKFGSAANLVPSIGDWKNKNAANIAAFVIVD